METPATTAPTTDARTADRVEALLTAMTLEQKVAQLQCHIVRAGNVEAGIASFPHGLGALATYSTGGSMEADADHYDQVQAAAASTTEPRIPPLLHGESLSGWMSRGTTVFPSAIALGATWNPGTVEKMTDVVRRQMLALGVRQALSPVMDVARDPRWGRVGETYGEDPTLCAAMSVAFVRGLQGPDLAEGVAATGKHFLGFGLGEAGLNMTSNPIPPRELREVYAKPFQAAITEAGLAAVMNSYGSLDGELVITSKHVLEHLLREEMAFEGLLVSDYMSINLAVQLNVAEDPTDGGVRALAAGLDVELPTPYGFADGLVQAVRRGDLDECVVDRSVRRMLTLKARLGLLDGGGARRELIAEAYDRDRHRPCSLQAAREAIVLLKNDGLLPLSKDTRKIAVIGPHESSTRLFFGCYTLPAGIELTMSGTVSEIAGMLDDSEPSAEEDGPRNPLLEGSAVQSEAPELEQALQAMFGSNTPTILDAIKAKCPGASVVHARGSDIAGTDRGGFDAAVAAAEAADVVILTLGGKYGWGSTCTSGEGIDTWDVGLLGVQEELARQIHATGTPTVLVHMDAKPLSSELAAEQFPAILENWFPGETGGEALADVLFGDYNPAGRLPMTAVRNAGQIPLYAGHRRSNSFTGGGGQVLNRYVDGSKLPLFHFGHGMSYTTFEYANLALDEQVDPRGTLHLSCDITNTGERDGDEVVQLYVRDELASMVRPAQELAGFKRLSLAAGEMKTVDFRVRADQFAFLDVDMRWVVEAGAMTARIGSSSADIRLEGSFTIADTAFIDGKSRGFYASATVR
jgi:beta-glucosidase